MMAIVMMMIVVAFRPSPHSLGQQPLHGGAGLGGQEGRDALLLVHEQAAVVRGHPHEVHPGPCRELELVTGGEQGEVLDRLHQAHLTGGEGEEEGENSYGW